MKTFVAKKEEVQRGWFVVDASGVPLGRLAVTAAYLLKGKHKPVFTPHVDTGDFVVVINAGRVKLTGNKVQYKAYKRYTGYLGSEYEVKVSDLLDKHPEKVIEMAVRRMLPKNKLGRAMFRKLKVYAGGDHPHAAQRPVAWNRGFGNRMDFTERG